MPRVRELSLDSPYEFSEQGLCCPPLFAFAFGFSQESSHLLRNGFAFVLESKVTRVEQMQLCFRQISLKGLRACHGEERIALAPDDQRRRPVLPEIRLPLRIELKVGCVVVEQADLNGVVARAVEAELVERVGVRADLFWIPNTLSVLKLSRLGCEERADGLLGFRRAIRP